MPTISKSVPLLLDGFLHPSMETDEELRRRGRLQIQFGVLGGIIAVVYSAFFFFVEHFWGGCIVAASGLAIMQVPWIVRKTGNLTLTGHLYGAVLLMGFTGMCAAGGGLQGYAYAWLASVPVCALLLMNLHAALIWSFVCFITLVTFAVCDMTGVGFLKTYGSQWESSIEAVSHIGLFIFLSVLGLLFEKTRIEAFDRLQESNGKLAVANQDLIDLNEQKNEFLNIAAHNLKNPLSIICGYADLLRELESPTLEQIRDQSNEILRSGERMLEIISNILDVRAIEDGQTKLSSESCNVQDIIQKLLTEYAPIGRAKDIGLVYSVSTYPPKVWGDPGAIHQILDNLVSNAIKYTPRGGVVTIEHATSEDAAIVEIKDTGPGLSEKDQAKLWGKFVRLTPRPTAGENSNGLGLWIVQHLARKMDGDAFCRSKPGEGSIFGIRLPLFSIRNDSEGVSAGGRLNPNGMGWISEEETVALPG